MPQTKILLDTNAYLRLAQTMLHCRMPSAKQWRPTK